MARTAFQVAVATARGAILTGQPADLVNGNSFVNDGKTALGVFNPDLNNPLTVTLKVGSKFDGDLSIGDRVYTIPANQRMVISFVPTSYNNEDGTVSVDFSGAAAVAVISFQ